MGRFNINISQGLNAIINNLGTKAGTVLSIIALFSAGFTCGNYYQDYVKNIEILDLKKENYVKLQELTSEKQIKELEISQLKFTLQNNDKKDKK